MSIAAYDSLARRLGMNENDQKAALSEYMANGGVNLDPSVTAWCAGAVQAALGEAGLEGTNALNARSYLDWGQAVDQPQRGDVAVFSRGDPNGWQGHVGLFDSINPDGTIRVLGGNQGDAIGYANFDPNALLGYRREEGAGPVANPQNALAATPEPEPFRQMQQYAMLDPAMFQSRRRY